MAVIDKLEVEYRTINRIFIVGVDDVEQILVNGAFSSNLKAKATISYKSSKRVEIINLDNSRSYSMTPKGNKGEVF